MTISWKIIFFGALGIVLGVLGNMYANKISERNIIDTLTAQINALTVKIQELKDQQQVGRITPEGQKQMTELQAQIDILSSITNQYK